MELNLSSLAMGASLLAEPFRLVIHKTTVVDDHRNAWNEVQVQTKIIAQTQKVILMLQFLR
jgi:hypothetical protein